MKLPLEQNTKLFNHITERIISKGTSKQRSETYIPWNYIYAEFLQSEEAKYIKFDYKIIDNAFIVTPELKPLIGFGEAGEAIAKIPFIPVALELTPQSQGTKAYDIDAVASRALTKAIALNTGIGLELWDNEWRDKYLNIKKTSTFTNAQPQSAFVNPPQHLPFVSVISKVPKPEIEEAPNNKPEDPVDFLAKMNPFTRECYDAYLSLPMAKNAEIWANVKATAWALKKEGNDPEQIMNWIKETVKFRTPSKFNNAPIAPVIVSTPPLDEPKEDEINWDLEF